MKKNLALAAIALVFLLGAAFQSSNSVSSQLSAIQTQLSALQAQVTSLAAQIASNGPRKFYLTKTQHNGAQASSACATAYHMASLWQIHDPTYLRYDTELGLVSPDGNGGPPANIPGWIRTGFDVPSILGNAGTGNCNTYTSADNAHFGTAVALTGMWRFPPGGDTVSVVDPWVAQAYVCNFTQPVWCVQD